MANTVVATQDGSRILDQILKKLGYTPGGIGSIRKHARWSCTTTPAVNAGSQAAYPVEIGDLAWDSTNEHAWICTVAPAASTAATFVKLHA
jgi:hypothetical protein